MKETKITKSRIVHHFTYSWWKYLLLISVAAFGWNIIYTSTAYRPPRDKRLDVTYVSYTLPDEFVDWIKQSILDRYPEVEDSNVVSISLTADDDYYGSIQLTTYIGAGEGDIYILPEDQFKSLAASSAFVPLDDAVKNGIIPVGDTDVSSGIRAGEDGNTALYGIPIESLYGLMDHDVDNRGLYLTVIAYSANVDRAIDWAGWFFETMQAPKPEWLVEYEAKNEVLIDGISEMPSY